MGCLRNAPLAVSTIWYGTPLVATAVAPLPLLLLLLLLLLPMLPSVGTPHGDVTSSSICTLYADDRASGTSSLSPTAATGTDTTASVLVGDSTSDTTTPWDSRRSYSSASPVIETTQGRQ